MVAVAGWSAVETDLLQIGTDTAAVYFVPYPTPAWLVGEIRMVGWLAAVRIAADTAWFLVLPAAHLATTVLVARGRVRSRLGIGVTTLAAVGYLAVYPRTDFWHLLPLAVPSVCALLLAVSYASSRWQRGMLALLALASVARFLPTLPVLRDLARAPGAGAHAGRLDVRFDLLRDERLVHLPAVASAVQGKTRVAGFPALGIVNFALGTPSPWRHDYFFPGRPGAAEEAELARRIIADPPDAVVVLDDAPGPLSGAAAAHPAIVGAFEARLVEAQRIGPYRILVPRDPP
jgi:hypothetical protein